MDAGDETGPALPPRGVVYAKAAEIHALARLAMDNALQGPNADLPRALRQLEHIRLVLGESE